MTRAFLYCAIVALVCCVHATFVGEWAYAIAFGGVATMCVFVDVAFPMMRKD